MSQLELVPIARENRRYPAALRAEAVRLVVTTNELTNEQAAAHLDVPKATLASWTRQARAALKAGIKVSAAPPPADLAHLHPALHRAVSLAPEGSYYLVTKELAGLLRCDNYTLARAHREKGNYAGIRPVVLDGRLLWPIDQISAMLYAAENGGPTP